VKIIEEVIKFLNNKSTTTFELRLPFLWNSEREFFSILSYYEVLEKERINNEQFMDVNSPIRRRLIYEKLFKCFMLLVLLFIYNEICHRNLMICT